MALIYSSTNNFWIKPNALNIGLNHFDNPNLIEVSLLAGVVIMAYKQDVIAFNAAHNYRTWRLNASRTFLEKDDRCYVYARLDRAETSNYAQVIYSYQQLDMLGRATEDATASEYYYILLGVLSPAIDSDGNKVNRTWEEGFYTGSLATDQYIKEETGGDWTKMFSLNAVTGFIDVLKTISSATINVLKVVSSFSLAGKTVKGIDDSAATTSSDDHLATSGYVDANALSSDKADTAKGKITFAQGVNIDSQDITGVDVESDVLDGGLTKAKDTSVPTTAAMVKHTHEYGDANYLSKVKDDTAEGVITFERGLKVGNYTPGVADGTGGAMEVSEGVVTTTTDYLNVRRKARFSEVEILTTHHIGGAQMSSAASCKIDHVVTRSDEVYQCFFRKTDADGRTITNDWKKGDQAYCNTFNLSEQADGTKGNHFFWRLVVSTDAVTGTLTSGLGETFNASEYHCLWIAMNDRAEGSDAPQAGDEVVLLGHRPQSGEIEADYAGRQSAIYQVASGTDGRPYYRQYVDINSFSLEGCLEQQMMPNDNIFKGSMTITGGRAREELDSKATLSELSYSASNLLRNTGFYGDGKSAQISGEQWINVDEEMMSPSLLYWTVEQGEPQVVSDTDSASGYALNMPSGSQISQKVEQCMRGENYLLSMRIMGYCTVEFGGESIEVSGGDNTYSRIVKSFKSLNNESTFNLITVDKGCQICEIMLERGTIPSNNWQRSIHDVNPEIIRVQNLQYLADAMQKGQTDILGGLILTNMIQLGKPKSTGAALEEDEVTCGINGNNTKGDNEVAIWGGGTWMEANETVNKFIENPQSQPTQEDLAKMAKFVITHGGTAILNEAIVRGTVFATNGQFTGEVNATSGTFENGTFKNVVINGTYNKLFQTINDDNYRDFFHADHTGVTGYPYLLSWGDALILNGGTLTWTLPCINPTYVYYPNDKSCKIETDGNYGYKKDGTPMSLDDIRSLVGRKILIYNNTGQGNNLTINASIFKIIADHPDATNKYYTVNPYADGEWCDTLEDTDTPKAMSIPTGRVAVLECMFGEKYIETEEIEETGEKATTTAEMIYWACHFLSYA